jgi:periplasmic divalent cation tolerance protein
MGDEIIVFMTAASRDEAAKIGKTLVDEHLAACVNIVPEIRSIYFWEGRTHDEAEALLIAKSRQPLLEKLVQRVESLHSYTVPEIIALPIVGGSTKYLQWLNETTKS